MRRFPFISHPSPIHPRSIPDPSIRPSISTGSCRAPWIHWNSLPADPTEALRGMQSVEMTIDPIPPSFNSRLRPLISSRPLHSEPEGHHPSRGGGHQLRTTQPLPLQPGQHRRRRDVSTTPKSATPGSSGILPHPPASSGILQAGLVATGPGTARTDVKLMLDRCWIGAGLRQRWWAWSILLASLHQPIGANVFDILAAGRRVATCARRWRPSKTTSNPTTPTTAMRSSPSRRSCRSAAIRPGPSCPRSKVARLRSKVAAAAAAAAVAAAAAAAAVALVLQVAAVALLSPLRSRAAVPATLFPSALSIRPDMDRICSRSLTGTSLSIP